MGRVSGKVAMVSGGASGIGKACAELLAAEGAFVLVTDIQQEAGAQTVKAIVDNGGKASFVLHDVTDEAAWVTVIEQVVAERGGLHVLVNNAGIGIGGSIVDMPLSDWQRQQAINLDGVFLGVKHAIPAMRKAGGGSIINMSSSAGLKGAPNLAAYNATKGGVRLFTKGVALECAQQRWPIRVNSVHPGIIDTPIWDTAAPAISGEEGIDIQALAETIVPSGKLGDPRDVANGVLFLASDESTYITGTELVIDGGLTA